MASPSTNTAGHDSPSKGTAVLPLTPWKQVVAGFGDAEPGEVKADKAAADASKKPVWNKPSTEALQVVEPVMGADSWPALSEISKVPQKSSGDSSKSFPDPPVPISLGNGPSPSAQKLASENPRPNAIQKQAHPVRQKSFQRHGGHASGNNGNTTHPPPPPILAQSATMPSNHNTSSSQKNNNLEYGQKVASESQSHGTNDKLRHNNHHRRVNGHHLHGDGSNNHRFGARRNQDRPNRDWNSQLSFNGRDVHPQGTGVLPRGIISNIPLPHDSAPFIAPPLSPAIRPFGLPVRYPEFPFYYVPVQPESIRGMSFPYPAAARHHLLMQNLDPELYSKIIYQIDYYFSNDNLSKDIFLRKNMDEQGWVPIKLIAGFKKIKTLTDNIALITEAIQTSTVVEVKNDQVRRRNDWLKWIMPESLRIPSQSTYLDPGSSSEFGARIQEININGESPDIQCAIPLSGDPQLLHPTH